jgi:hypothetical protein
MGGYNVARRIGHKVGHIFRKREPRSIYYARDMRGLAEALSGVEGASWILCGGCCKSLLPVVFSNGGSAEIIGLACVDCEAFLPVEVGIVFGRGATLS